MIDVTQIMVGDYLQNTNGDIGKVLGIRPYFGTDPSLIEDYEIVMRYNENGTAFSDPKLLEPIPITENILKKYGFFYKGGIWVVKTQPRLGWYPRQHQLIVDYHTFPVDVEFVHQLQHVMRAVGLKEVEP